MGRVACQAHAAPHSSGGAVAIVVRLVHSAGLLSCSGYGLVPLHRVLKVSGGAGVRVTSVMRVPCVRCLRAATVEAMLCEHTAAGVHFVACTLVRVNVTLVIIDHVYTLSVYNTHANVDFRVRTRHDHDDHHTCHVHVHVQR